MVKCGHCGEGSMVPEYGLCSVCAVDIEKVTRALIESIHEGLELRTMSLFARRDGLLLKVVYDDFYAAIDALADSVDDRLGQGRAVAAPPLFRVDWTATS